VSAPTANGILPGMAIELINKIAQSGKLVAADIAALNPSLDRDEKTSRLASKLAMEILTICRRSRLQEKVPFVTFHGFILSESQLIVLVGQSFISIFSPLPNSGHQNLEKEQNPFATGA
jgi:hypothetical protein